MENLNKDKNQIGNESSPWNDLSFASSNDVSAGQASWLIIKT